MKIKTALALAWALAIGAAHAASVQPPATVLYQNSGTWTAPQAQGNALNALSRLADRAQADNPRVNPPMGITAWAANTTYYVGSVVSNGGYFYEEQAHPNAGSNATCVSAGSGGPTLATQTMIVDNTCKWNPIQITTTNTAPTFYAGAAWAIGTAFPAGSYTSNYTGSGATGFVNFYKTSAACTSAASGSGPNPGGTGTATFSGSVMTVTAASPAGFAATQTITAMYPGFPSGITISSLGTGTGGTGTYNLSASVPTVATAVPVVGAVASVSDNTCTWAYQKSAPGAQYSAAAQKSIVYNAGAGTLGSSVAVEGGYLLNNPGTSYASIAQSTVSGVASQDGAARIEFGTNAQTLLFRSYVLTASTSTWRFIVCDANRQGCQYANLNPTPVGVAGWNNFLLDFSAVGGRRPRVIIVEQADSFGGIDVSAEDDIWLPIAGQRPLTFAIIGDSYSNAGGVPGAAWSFPAVTADLLGVRNFIDLAIGGCAYGPVWSGTASFATNQMTVVSTTAGQLSTGLYLTGSPTALPANTTISSGTGPYTLSTTPGTIATENVTADLCNSGGPLSRLTDLTSINGGAGPDVLVIANGTNNEGINTTAYTTTMEQSLLTAIRAQYPNLPIFVMGSWAHNNGGTSCANCVAMETALLAGTSGYTGVYNCPVTNDPSGSWETGTGSIETPNGGGNTDWAFSTTSGHPNAAWMKMAGYRLAACIRNTINTNKW